MKFSTPTSLYILFFFFIPDSIALVNVPGIPLLSVSRMYIIIWIILFLLFFYKFKIIRIGISTYPFYKPMIVLLLSMLISTATAQYFTASVNALISFFLESFFVSMMIWVAYRKPEDIIQLIDKLTLIFAVLSIYGTISYLIGVNPILEFVDTHLDNEFRMLTYSYADKERLGLIGRAQSIFSHPIQYGAFLTIMVCVSYYYSIEKHGLKKYIFLTCTGIFLFSLMLTHSRTPFLFLIVITLTYWCFDRITSKIKLILIILMIGVIALLFANDSMLQLYSSTFIELLGGESGVRGSSMQMRLEQLSASFSLFLEAPITGHGLSTIRILVENEIIPIQLRGAESILFILFIDTGIVGIISHIYFYTFTLYYFLKQRIYPNWKVKRMCALTIAIVCGYIVFLLATGYVKTFIFFIIIITLHARYIYLCNHKNNDTHSTMNYQHFEYS